MKNISRILLFVAFFVSVAMAQDNDDAAKETNKPDQAVTVPDTPLPAPIFSKTEAHYSARAFAAGIEGTVIVHVFIGIDGVPYDMKVLQTLDPDLDLNAMGAISQWRFQPAIHNGKPATWDTTVNMNFRLHRPQEVMSTGSAGSTGGKLRRAAGIALTIAQQLALQNICPRIYRKPLVFMNANELEWLQVCNENGSMLFGVYVQKNRY